jgi:hypothetical protein
VTLNIAPYTSWRFPSRTVSMEPASPLAIPFSQPAPAGGGTFIEINGDFLGSTSNGSARDRVGRTGQDDPITGKEFTSFLTALVREAQGEVEKVHGIILPELALNQRLVDDVGSRLLAETDLELFITGVSVPAEKGHGPQNRVHTSMFLRAQGQHGPVKVSWDQAKHHRWQLEASQIGWYQLGDRLHPELFWWEFIDLPPRYCHFVVFREIGSLVTLVCEDLARIEPVQSVIRSVGPTLVIALLMDGAQLEKRWSGRYATVLADDPGSAVLTLTSLGLLRRSRAEEGKQPNRQVGLWKGAEGVARELTLPEKHHALLLTLSTVRKVNYTLDGRSDSWGTIGLLLSKHRAIRLANPPAWAEAE